MISSTDVCKAVVFPLNFSNAVSDLELLDFDPHLHLIKSLGLLEDISETIKIKIIAYKSEFTRSKLKFEKV